MPNSRKTYTLLQAIQGLDVLSEIIMKMFPEVSVKNYILNQHG